MLKRLLGNADRVDVNSRRTLFAAIYMAVIGPSVVALLTRTQNDSIS